MAKDPKIPKTTAAQSLDSFADSVTKALKKKDGKGALVGIRYIFKSEIKSQNRPEP